MSSCPTIKPAKKRSCYNKWAPSYTWSPRRPLVVRNTMSMWHDVRHNDDALDDDYVEPESAAVTNSLIEEFNERNGTNVEPGLTGLPFRKKN